MSHSLKCEPLTGRTNTRQWEVCGRMLGSFLFGSFMNAKWTGLRVADRSHRPCAGAHTPTCGCVVFVPRTVGRSATTQLWKEEHGLVVCSALDVCVWQAGERLFLADSEPLWNGEVLPDVCRGCCRPPRVELLLFKTRPDSADLFMWSTRPAGNVYSCSAWSKPWRPEEKGREREREG